jgi:hypothetical protein
MSRGDILGRLGWQGIVGIALLLFCGIFYASATVPARDETESLNAERERMAAAAEPSRQAVAPVVQKLPAFAQAPELLKQLNAVAQRDGIDVARSSYQVKDEDSRRVFEVDQPLRLAYPALRAYLRDVLAMAPSARIEDLNLHRARAADPVIDADVRLSFSFSAAS